VHQRKINYKVNVGKKFELAWKESTPKDILIYRLPDAAQSFGGGSSLRFSRKSPFDFLMYNGKYLFALELKSVQGKSISFERTKEDDGEIHYHQIVGLNEWSKYSGTICGFIIEFRELERTIFLPIEKFNELVQNTTKKSLNIKDLEEHVIEIKQRKLRTRYRYDVDGFVAQVTSHGG